MLKNGVQMSSKKLLACGGLELENWNTIILFSRWRFRRENIEDFAFAIDMSVPVFKGRPRKRKNQNTNIKLPIKKKAKSASNPTARADAFKKSKSYDVPVTRAATSLDTSTLQMKLKKASEKKECTVVTDSHLKNDTNVNGKDINAIDQSAFNTELYSFMRKRGTPILKIPSVGCAKVDLYKLFTLVTAYGGYGQVTLKKHWRSVYDGLGHSNSITNSATCTRKVYEKLLLAYEKHLRKKSQKKQKTPTKEEIVQDSTEKLDSFSISDVPSFTIQAGNAFKLMIQKRRGRPSKEFREQIERLKNMNEKVEVEIYPPLSKHSKLPAWLNALNVDIVNPGRKRKSSTIIPQRSSNTLKSKIELTNNITPREIAKKHHSTSTLQSTSVSPSKHASTPRKLPSIASQKTPSTPLQKPPSASMQKPPVTIPDKPASISHDTESVSSGTESNCSARLFNCQSLKNVSSETQVSRSKNMTITQSSDQQISKTINIDPIYTEDTGKGEPHFCEFEIKSVRSLAPGHNQSDKSESIIHYPYSSIAPAITVPHSVLTYHEFMPPHDQSKLYKEHRNKVNVVASHYPVNYSFHDSQFSAQGFGRHSTSEERNISHTSADDNDLCSRRPVSPNQIHARTIPRHHEVHSPPRDRNSSERAIPYIRRKGAYMNKESTYPESYIIHHPVRVHPGYEECTRSYPIVYTHQPQYLRREPLYEESRRTRKEGNHGYKPIHSADIVTSINDELDRDHHNGRYQPVQMLNETDVVLVPRHHWALSTAPSDM